MSSPPIIGIQKVAPVRQVQSIPEVERMRRGRPQAPSHAPPMTKPSPSPAGRGAKADPFAALDSEKAEVRIAAADELAARYPSLDEFSLLHDRGQKFEFSQSPGGAGAPLNTRVTEALADEAFSLPPAKTASSAPASQPPSAAPSTTSRPTPAQKPQRFDGPRESPRSSNPMLHQPTPQRSQMVSTGVQTSPAPSPAPTQPQLKFPDVNKRPVWRVPDTSNHSRTMSQPRTFEKPLPSPSSLRPDHTLPTRPSLDAGRSKSHTSTLSIQSPASSRPSLETHRPSAMDLGVSLDRAKSAQSNRPNSIHVASNLDFLREREAAPGRSFDAPSLARGGQSPAILDSDSEDERNIASNMDYLRARENEESQQKNHRRTSSQNKKRSSLHSLTSGTKNIVKGRFGDAFKMFESNSTSGQDRGRSDSGPRTPTDLPIDPRSNALTPIAGSEATGGVSDDERNIDETEDLPPEVRRELERRRLSQEERRVEAAAAEYRKRLAEEGKGKAGPTRASTIQNRVKNLLDESQKQAPASRTAEGYGKYTDTGKPLPQRPQDQSGGGARQPPPAIARKPIALPHQVQQNTNTSSAADLGYTKPRPHQPVAQPPTSSASAPPAANRVPTGGPRPPPPSKPTKLRTGGTGDFSASGVARQSPTKGGGVRDKPLPPAGGGHGAGHGAGEDEWDMDSFSKRYPSLNKLEMVEREIPAGRGRDVRDV